MSAPDDNGGGGGGASNNNNNNNNPNGQAAAVAPTTTTVYRATVFEAGLRQFSSLLRRPGGGAALPGAARQLGTGDAPPTAAMYAGGGLAPPANPPLLRPSPSGPLPATAPGGAGSASASPPLPAGGGASSGSRTQQQQQQQQEPTSSAAAALARSQSADAATVAAAAGASPPGATDASNHRVRRFLRILHGPAAALDPASLAVDHSDPAVVDLDALREAAWSGVPPPLRPQVWRLLLGYAPPSRARQAAALARRRREYLELAQELCGEHAALERSEDEAALQRQVAVDCPRTAPGEAFVRDPRVQALLARLLYVWGVRHPASGYVQGMNDIVTPFLAVFLGERLGNMVAAREAEAAGGAGEGGAGEGGGAGPSSSSSPLQRLLPPPPPPMADWPALLPQLPDSELAEAEADSYWCLSRMLESIQDHYTYAQPGIQRAVFRVRELLSHGGVCPRLAAHLDAQGLDNYLQFAFRWVNCLLAREVPFALAIRLWDTYLAEEKGGGAAGGGEAGVGGAGSAAAASGGGGGGSGAAAATAGTGRGLAEFLVYACAAFLAAWERELLACADFQELLLFLQRPPTAQWGERDVETLLSRAYVWMRGYSGAQGHLKGPSGHAAAGGGGGGGS